MNKPSLLQESIVSESEIDGLGHMNVRYYVSRAADANTKLLHDIGLKAADGLALRRTDTYNRFHKEQFVGAKLGVYGGIITVEGNSGISGYYEIRNMTTDDLAASFIITSNLIERTSEEILPLPAISEEMLSPFRTEVPAAALPRSLSLSPPRHVSFEEISALIPEQSSLHSMNGRREGLVTEEDCDESGRLKEGVDPMFVMFRAQAGENIKSEGPPIQRDEQGRRYSFAMMEIRSINWHRPSLGNTIISLSSDVNFGEKWRHTRRWMFAKETGVLLGISDHAAVCMDLDARKAIPIPAEIREEMERSNLLDYV